MANMQDISHNSCKPELFMHRDHNQGLCYMGFTCTNFLWPNIVLTVRLQYKLWAMHGHATQPSTGYGSVIWGWWEARHQQEPASKWYPRVYSLPLSGWHWRTICCWWKKTDIYYVLFHSWFSRREAAATALTGNPKCCMALWNKRFPQ